MTEKPDDRVKPVEEESQEPKIFAVINGKEVVRPGLETFFVDPEKTQKPKEGCACDPVVYPYCACNKVAVTSTVKRPACTCVGHKSKSRSSGYRVGCRCAPVH